MKRIDKMQDTTINNLNLTIFDIGKLPDLPVIPVISFHEDVETLGTIYSTGQATTSQGKIYNLHSYKGIVYKTKGDWDEGRGIGFHFRSIDWLVITFDTIEAFQKIVKALNNLDSCLKEIAEFAEKTLREKLNTNQRPSTLNRDIVENMFPLK